MTTQIDALTDILCRHGVKARAWKARRIYINGHGRDISAYIELDEPERDVADLDNWGGPGVPPDTGCFEGCALRVFSNAQQGQSWLINRAKQVKHDLMGQIATAMIAEGASAEVWEVTDIRAHLLGPVMDR